MGGEEAGFAHHPFVIAPMYYQSLVGVLAPQEQAGGSMGWALPLDPTVRGIHMGDITELGNIVAGALAQPDEAGNGEYLPLVFHEIVETLIGRVTNYHSNKCPGKFSLFSTLGPPRWQRRSLTFNLIPT